MNTERAADRSDRRTGYATIRLDLSQLDDGKPTADSLQYVVTVRSVVPDHETAEREVARLNQSRRRGTESIHFWQGTRLDGGIENYE